MRKIFTYLFTIIFIQFLGPHVMAQTSSSSGSSSLGQGSTFGSVGVNVKKNLTDEEQNTINTFYHEGLANEILVEECEKSSTVEDACTDKAAYVFSEKGDLTVEALSKMMSLFSLASGQAGAQSSSTQGSGSKSGSGYDYCGLIPAGTEASAQYYQTASQDTISESLALPDTTSEDDEVSTNTFVNQQKEAVLALQRSHLARESSAKIQTAGWSVTAGCYGASLVKPGQALSPMTLLKGAAAGALGAFYNAKYQKQKKYQAILDDLVAKLPDVGDCNPITERQCYCTQEKTKNDPKYCLPQLLAARANDATTVVACVNNALEEDAECKCLETDTCQSKTFKDLTVSSGFGTAANADLLKQTNSILEGNLSKGDSLTNLSSAQLAKANSIIRKTLAKNPNIKIETKELDDDQQLQAEGLIELGVAPKIARHFAGLPATTQSKQLAKRLRGNSRRYIRAKSKKRKNGTNVLSFKSGRGLKSGSSGINRRTSSRNTRKGKTKTNLSAKIINFSNKAQQSAQVNRDSSKPLFDIISHRYKLSGWNYLEVKK